MIIFVLKCVCITVWILLFINTNIHLYESICEEKKMKKLKMSKKYYVYIGFMIAELAVITFVLFIAV
jgi:hypothetical protein